MKPIYVIIASLVVMSCLACSGNKAGGKHEEGHEEGHSDGIELSDEQMNTVGIKVGALEMRNLNSVVRASGVLEVVPEDRADVASLAAGIVRRIMVTEGSRVKKGQVVAMVENAEIVEMQKNYLAAVGQCRAAYQDYERQKGLSQHGAGVKKNLQQAYSAYELAKVEMNGLAGQLRQLSINPDNVSKGRFTRQIPVYAPISGVVNNVTAAIGSFTDMQKPLMAVANTAGIYCDLKVFEKDISAITPGQRVDMVLTNRPGVSLSGVVEKVNDAFDAQSRAVSVFVRLTSRGDGLLIPGMYVTALVNTGGNEVQAVPEDAVAMVENTPCLFLLEKTATEEGRKMYHFKKVKVATGVSGLGYTQVTPLEPLPEGAQVVTANAFYLASMVSEHGEHAH